METDSLKMCHDCGKEKPRTPEFFHRQRDTGDGFANRCKVCVREYQQKLYSDTRKKMTRSRKKTAWSRGNRQARRQEEEGKVGDLLRLLQRQGTQILERRTSKYGYTTLVRILRPDGQVQTIYFRWKFNQFYRKDSNGSTKEERQIEKKLQKSAERQARRNHSSRVVQEDAT